MGRRLEDGPAVGSFGTRDRWDRPSSRAAFLRRTAVAVGGLSGVGLLDAATALGSSGADPVPIPGGFDSGFNPVAGDPFIHVLPPQVGYEMSTITNFAGLVAAADTQGTANGGTYDFDCDMRFMQGLYRATDGRLRLGTFGFV
jgi:hypothetical protein